MSGLVLYEWREAGGDDDDWRHVRAFSASGAAETAAEVWDSDGGGQMASGATVQLEVRLVDERFASHEDHGVVTCWHVWGEARTDYYPKQVCNG